MHICSSNVSNKYPILLQCNMNESNQKHNISRKAWEWDYTHFIFYKVLQKKYIRGRIFLRQTAIIFIKPRHDMEKNIAHKFCSTSNAFSSLALLLSCVYGCYGNLFRMSGQFFPFQQAGTSFSLIGKTSTNYFFTDIYGTVFAEALQQCQL